MRTYGKKNLVQRLLWRLANPRKDYYIISLSESRAEQKRSVRL